MCDQHAFIGWKVVQAFCDDIRISSLSPGELNARHIQSIYSGDFCEAIAEGSNRNSNNMVARREEIDHRAFLAASTGGRIGQDWLFRLEKILQTGTYAAQYSSELWSAMVDHWLCLCLKCFSGNHRWARNAQVLIGDRGAGFHLWNRNRLFFLGGHTFLHLCCLITACFTCLNCNYYVLPR